MTTLADLDRLTTGLPEAAAALAQRVQQLLNAVAGPPSPVPVTAHLPLGGGNAAALLGSECAAARAEELSAPPGSSAR